MSHGLSDMEMRTLQKLDTPVKIQNFLEKIPINFELRGETYRSPRRVLRDRTAHCFEGALLAAAALLIQGEPPLVLDLRTLIASRDTDHVVALFHERGHWGAISKTNHAVLRYREPVYRTPRELALSYFHEYFLDNGAKTLQSYSRPFDLRKFLNRGWLTSEEELFYLVRALDRSPHEPILPPKAMRNLRRADPIEIKAGKLVEWRKTGRKAAL